MRKFLLFIITAFLFVTFSPESHSASVPDGQIIVRVEDSAASRCINSSTDRITMHLRRIIADKDVGIFTEDKLAAVVINTIISGVEAGTTPKKVSFPRMYTVSVSPYSKGYVSLPVEEKLFSRFQLSAAENSYDSAEIEFSLVIKKNKTHFGIALSALADITKNLPAPINPFSEGFKYFADYANKVVEASLNEENNVAESVKESKITMSFSSTDTCAVDQEKTGTIAIVKGANGSEKDGFVDIKKEYCWKAEYKPVFTLKFAQRDSNIACKDIPSDAFIQVNNPYVAFFLNAEPNKITTSQKRQIKSIYLPEQTIQSSGLPYESVEKSIASAYVNEKSVSAAPADHAAAVKKVSEHTERVLNDPIYLKMKSTNVRGERSNEVKLDTTVMDSLAVDLAQSLRRCSSHGIEPEQCF